MEALCILLIMACGYDYRTGKIPNYLTGVMAILGMVWRWRGGGAGDVLFYLGETAIVMLLLYPLFRIGGLGAGDVKLLGVTAGYLPFEKILFFLFFSLLAAAVISLIKMWKQNNFTERVRYLWEYLTDVLRSGSWKIYLENERDRQAAGICLSGPVLVSVLLYLGGIY